MSEQQCFVTGACQEKESKEALSSASLRERVRGTTFYASLTI